MDEATVRADIRKALIALGFWPIHTRDAVICHRCGNKALPSEPGRPDLLVLKPNGQGVVIEVKRQKNVKDTFAQSFDKTLIEEDQRQWMDRWEESGGRAFFAFGTVVPRKRSVWVIPWGEWKAHEKTVSGNSIPIARELYKRRLASETIEEKFIQYELQKVAGGFAFRENHPVVKIAAISWEMSWS